MKSTDLTEKERDLRQNIRGLMVANLLTIVYTDFIASNYKHDKKKANLVNRCRANVKNMKSLSNTICNNLNLSIDDELLTEEVLHLMDVVCKVVAMPKEEQMNFLNN
ncbi:MAG: hypothetical protein K2Q03_06010 [Sphingobacteriaceae bacterium]|nr:hypothetical protein [Sphingobacteriaceae bacterium]